MGVFLDRARILLEQGRYDLAERELQQELAAQPDDPLAHALLALCLAQREQYDEATREAQLAIEQGPDLAFAHYALASILHDRERLEEAEKTISEAIQLDPEDANSFALRASILFDQRRWDEALRAAEQGLCLEPEHATCSNLRAMALVQLGRAAEAGSAIEQALARDPSNAVTHANQGWALLHQGRHAQALEHFREALRLDPDFDMARQGIIAALKARYRVYRFFLRFFLHMSGLSKRALWGVIAGGAIGFLVFYLLMRYVPSVGTWVWPVLSIYVVFGILAWIADPLFHLLLRLDPLGRLALSQEQIVASNWVAGCLLTALVAAGAAWITGNRDLLIVAASVGLLVLPIAGTYDCREGWPREAMRIYTILLAAIALFGLTMLMLGPIIADDEERRNLARVVGAAFVLAFVLGAFLSSWVAFVLMKVRPQR